MDYPLYLLNGFSYGMLLFILAAGFTLILGTMGIVHLAYGAFYLLGVYVAFSAAAFAGDFFIGALVAACALGVVGLLVQGGLLSRLPNKPMPQALLTFGLIPIIAEGTKILWGARNLIPPKPEYLSGSLEIGSFVYPQYRLALIVAGFAMYLLLWGLLEKTTWGAVLRAGRDDAEMGEGVGLNIPIIWVLLFGFGCFLTGLAAGLGGPYLDASAGVDWTVLMMVFVVVVIGGIGSLKGAFVASAIVGISDNVGKVLFPELAMFLVFFLLVVVLAVKPTGLFGRVEG